MFETHAYDRRAHVRPPATPHPDFAPLPPAGEIAATSFLFWSEHCVECAAPDCYNACALYRPRMDGRCRRFDFGIYRNNRFTGMRGFGAEIAFRRWGKLKANGNTVMAPVPDIVRCERWFERTVALRRGLGCIAKALGRHPFWADPTRDLDRRARRQHRRQSQAAIEHGRGGSRPDAFLIEVYNPGTAEVSVELEMRIATDVVDAAAARLAPMPFRTTFDLAPGNNRHIVPRRAFAAVTESNLPFKLSLSPLGEATPHLVFLALDFVAWRMPARFGRCAAVAAAGPPAIKCVVFDLDDTVWHGTLVEAGATRLRPDVSRVFGELDRRGILLAVASKNDAGPALDRLRDFGLAEMLVAAKIDWRAKSVALSELAGELNLGLDAFAFVDDSGFERAEVAAALPNVACFDADCLPDLPNHPRLQGGTSEVAHNRRRLYAESTRRDAVRAQFCGDDDAFLRSCQLRLEIARYSSNDFDRVAELAQRTNQLNASGTRYSPAAFAALLADTDLCKLVLRCVDVYGDYGMVGFAPIRFVEGDMLGADLGANRLRIEEFMLSCRVQGRRLERALFDHLARTDRVSAARTMWINFRETGRNGPLAQVLDTLRFRPCADGGRVLELPAPHLASDLIEIVDLSGMSANGASA